MSEVKKLTEEIISFIKDYFKKNNLKGVVLGISGGKDSAVVAGLFCLALGKENVIGVTLPCHSNDEDKIDAKIVSDYFGFRLFNLDLTNVYDEFLKEFDRNFKEFGLTSNNSMDSNINLKPRLRMSSVYYLAQAFSTHENKTYVVAGTSNKCEIYVGYFTKGGDNVHDISILADLTVSQVIEIGKYINVPKKVLFKTPSDGISDKSDEEKLGVKYSDIEKVLDNKEIDKEIFDKIEKLHNRNKHKFNIPTYKQNVFFDK